MREAITRGDICLNDEYNLKYRVAEVEYIEREDESFIYKIKPNYSVIGLLSEENFQGIPGLDLDSKKKVYVRENIVPVFISERTPGRNREDLWKLLKDCDLEYLNQLEWLIRTNTRYSGDKLYVEMHEDKKTEEISIGNLGNRSAVICRKLLEAICYGNDIFSSSIKITDDNRKEYYELLIALYRTERKYLDARRNSGIAKSAKNGNYKGREKIKLDKLASQEIFLDYAANKISSSDGAAKLNISKSTFLRRYREYNMESGNMASR